MTAVVYIGSWNEKEVAKRVNGKIKRGKKYLRVRLQPNNARGASHSHWWWCCNDSAAILLIAHYRRLRRPYHHYLFIILSIGRSPRACSRLNLSGRRKSLEYHLRSCCEGNSRADLLDSPFSGRHERHHSKNTSTASLALTVTIPLRPMRSTFFFPVLCPSANACPAQVMFTTECSSTLGAVRRFR